MTLSRLERELANLKTQYDNAGAALGQAQVTEKIEVLSKGQRFTLIEAPIEKNTPVSPPRLMLRMMSPHAQAVVEPWSTVTFAPPTAVAIAGLLRDGMSPDV